MSLVSVHINSIPRIVGTIGSHSCDRATWLIEELACLILWLLVTSCFLHYSDLLIQILLLLWVRPSLQLFHRRLQTLDDSLILCSLLGKRLVPLYLLNDLILSDWIRVQIQSACNRASDPVLLTLRHLRLQPDHLHSRVAINRSRLGCLILIILNYGFILARDSYASSIIVNSSILL